MNTAAKTSNGNNINKLNNYVMIYISYTFLIINLTIHFTGI